MPDTALPLLLTTDLGSVKILIRERDEWGLLSDDAAPFPLQLDAFCASTGQPYATVPLTLEHVQAIHAAFGRFLAALIPADPLHRKYPPGFLEACDRGEYDA